MQRIKRKIGIIMLAAAAVALSCGSAMATDYTITDLGAATTESGTLIGPFGAKINNDGDVVGRARFSETGYSHAALWQNGVAYDLGTLHDQSEAHFISDSGLIVGEAYADPKVNNMYRQATVFSNGSVVNIHPIINFQDGSITNNSLAGGAANGYIVGVLITTTFLSFVLSAGATEREARVRGVLSLT